MVPCRNHCTFTEPLKNLWTLSKLSMFECAQKAEDQADNVGQSCTEQRAERAVRWWDTAFIHTNTERFSTETRDGCEQSWVKWGVRLCCHAAARPFRATVTTVTTVIIITLPLYRGYRNMQHLFGFHSSLRRSKEVRRRGKEGGGREGEG